MKYCRKCALSVNTAYEFCPLCASQLTDVQISEAAPAGEDASEDVYPRYHGEIKYNLALRLLLFISIVGASTSLLINLLLYNGVLWSLLVAGGIGIFWAAVIYPISARRNLGHHITVDAIAACVFFVVAQFVIGVKGWSLDYVVPFLFIAATTFISLVILIKRMKWREYAMYQFITILLGILPVISVIAGLVTTAWPSIVSAFYSFMTLLGMFIFADKKYKNELIKRFHF
ncbi:MAG: hypothetical protein GX847_05355 [Clostridiales bacterium]|nr:hypothetical protein [Clostridiales bacterium]